jgi:Cellulose biosynthesis protein BcsS
LTDGGYVPTTFDGEDAFLSALVGYQLRNGRLITKLFVGIEAEDQHIVPHDPNNSVQGTALGLRLEQETWFDISPRFYLSADASYGTAFQEYRALTRAGFRARPRFALGLEGGAIGNEEYDAGRAGGFVRMNFGDTEFTLSGGLHRRLSRRRPERLCRARHLSIILSFARSAFAKLHCRPRSGSAWPQRPLA